MQAFQSELECYTCPDVGVIPDRTDESADEGLKFYKFSSTLWTLAANDRSGAAWGEAVNGVFVAPDDGLLIVAVEGTSEAADFYGSEAADLPGWVVGAEPGGDGTPQNWRRYGVAVSPRKCQDLAEGERYEFNLVGRRGDDPPDIKVTFDWYWWDTGNWCLQHDQRVLDIEVKAFPCLYEPIEPVLPQYRAHERVDNAYLNEDDAELRLRCCPNESVPGNLWDWFVAWPAPPGETIQQGPAMGWKLNGNVLISPGAEGTKYEFAD